MGLIFKDINLRYPDHIVAYAMEHCLQSETENDKAIP